MKKRLKILISAYACNPYRGSEDGVGWGWVTMLAGENELWVLTAAFHRSDIEQEVDRNPHRYRKIHFIYVPHKVWHYSPEGLWLKIEDSMLKPLMHAAYKAWLRDAGRLGATLHRKIEFDLIHQVTYVGFRFPGRLWKLDVPFVWGPIGGLVNVPWRLLSVMGFRGAVEYGLRNIVNTIQKQFLSGPKRAFKQAKLVISATSGIQNEIFRWYGRKSEVICEIGPPQENVSTILERSPDEPIVMAWSGEHLPGKALQLLLRALSQLDDSIKWRLDILGKGPLTKTWRQQANLYGLEAYCQWYGWVTRDKALQVVRNAHVFIVTSLKDLTSTVLLEALSQGVPVICPNHCGFADVVNENCGIKINLDSSHQFIIDLATAISSLAINEHRRCQLAKGALRRINDFSWENKAHQINLIYQKIIDR